MAEEENSTVMYYMYAYNQATVKMIEIVKLCLKYTSYQSINQSESSLFIYGIIITIKW